MKLDAGGAKTVGYISPYWAVMLTDRDNADKVNMHPYVDRHTFPTPNASVADLVSHVKLTVQLPFLGNQRDLVAGELLVLPFDAGCPEIMSVPPPLKTI